MKLSATPEYVLMFGLKFGLTGIIGQYITVGILSTYNYPLLLTGLVLHATGT
jgi:hypothetical protein